MKFYIQLWNAHSFLHYVFNLKAMAGIISDKETLHVVLLCLDNLFLIGLGPFKLMTETSTVLGRIFVNVQMYVHFAHWRMKVQVIYCSLWYAK